jgi:hypothetical protein
MEPAGTTCLQAWGSYCDGLRFFLFWSSAPFATGVALWLVSLMRRRKSLPHRAVLRAGIVLICIAAFMVALGFLMRFAASQFGRFFS